MRLSDLFNAFDPNDHDDMVALGLVLLTIPFWLPLFAIAYLVGRFALWVRS